MKKVCILVFIMLTLLCSAGCIKTGGDDRQIEIPFPVVSVSTVVSENPPEPISGVSSVFIKFTDILIPLTVPDPGRRINLYDLDDNIPVERVGEPLSYDAFCSFIRNTDYDGDLSIFAECTRESFETHQYNGIDNMNYNAYMNYDAEEDIIYPVMSAFGYDSYIAYDGNTYAKPFMLDYNNDGTDEILVLSDCGWKTGYAFHVFAAFNGIYTKDGIIYTGVPEEHGLICGFYRYENVNFFITTGRLPPFQLLGNNIDINYAQINTYAFETSAQYSFAMIADGEADFYSDADIKKDPCRLYNPGFIELIEELLPLSIPEPDRILNRLDLDTVVPATRVGTPLSYGEFCDFIRPYEGVMNDFPYENEFSQCIRESYEASPPDGYVIYDADGLYSPNYNMLGYSSYTGINGKTYIKPIRVDYNNDGKEEILVLFDGGLSDGYCYDVYPNPESYYIFTRANTHDAPVCGFFNYKDRTYFISSSSGSYNMSRFTDGIISTENLSFYVADYRSPEDFDVFKISFGKIKLQDMPYS